MLIDPYSYVIQYKYNTFEELIKERNNLIKEIKKLEKIVFDEDKTDEDFMICPRADVRYQMYLKYLSEICNFICDKYNKEIVWKDADDEEEMITSTIEISKIGITKLEFIFTGIQQGKDVAEFVPWSDEIPEYCRLKKAQQK